MVAGEGQGSAVAAAARRTKASTTARGCIVLRLGGDDLLRSQTGSWLSSSRNLGEDSGYDYANVPGVLQWNISYVA
jgi:hypothetical protein